MDLWLREMALSPQSERRMLLTGAELLRSSKARQLCRSCIVALGPCDKD